MGGTKVSLIALTLLLATATAVTAQNITLITPLDGERITTDTELSFSTKSGALIHTCDILIDDNVFKTLTYEATIRDRTLRIQSLVPEGDHSWRIECATDSGPLHSGIRSFSASVAPKPDVIVTGSGTTRGSMMHTFTPGDHVIVVRRVAPGDYLAIKVGSATKELYVKLQSVKNGIPYLLLFDDGVNIYAYKDQNATVLVGSRTVLLNYQGLENNRAVVLVQPTVKKDAATPAQPAEPPATQDSTPPGSAQAPSPQPTQNNNQDNAPITNTTGNAAPASPPAPQPGLFRRLLGWLVSLLG